MISNIVRCTDVEDESADCSAMATGSTPPEANEAKKARIREREARRTRRRAARQMNGKKTPLLVYVTLANVVNYILIIKCLGVKNHHNGMSTDDEETTSDIAKQAAVVADVKNETESIFEDVVEEFHKFKNILSKFTEWREKYPDRKSVV